MMLYGRGDLNLAIISFARGAVQKFDLGHQGGQSKTKAVVMWLKDVFMYGGLDVQKHTFDKNLKFQPTWIIDFMRWFLFMCNGKMDGIAFHAIMKLQAFPPETYAYLLTAMCHAICDWEEGVEKKKPFTDDNASHYFSYLAQLKKLEAKSPTYFNRISRAAFKACLSQANKEWLLQHAAEDDDDDTDYNALEAAAKAAAEAEAV